MATAVQRYFDQQSGQYSKSSKFLLWRWQRNRETEAVDSLMGPVTREKIMDLGCGSGYYTRHFLKRGAEHITAVDASPSMISQLPKHHMTGIVEDAATIQLEEHFSRIICAGLLEFVAEPGKVLRSARDMVEDEGHMICLLPPDNWAGRLYRAYHRRHAMEINLFQRARFKDLCENSGWGVDGYQFVPPYSDVYRLVPLSTS